MSVTEKLRSLGNMKEVIEWGQNIEKKQDYLDNHRKQLQLQQ